MNLLPKAIRIILNIFYFIVYSIISLLLSGFILGNIFNVSMVNSDKIGYIVLVFVFLLTFIFRKFFYISLKNN